MELCNQICILVSQLDKNTYHKIVYEHTAIQELVMNKQESPVNYLNIILEKIKDSKNIEMLKQIQQLILDSITLESGQRLDFYLGDMTYDMIMKSQFDLEMLKKLNDSLNQIVKYRIQQDDTFPSIGECQKVAISLISLLELEKNQKVKR